MGYFKCTILFNIKLYHFIFILLIMTLVVLCLDNILMVLLISALAKIGATKAMFSDSGSSRRRGVGACVGMVCYHCIVHILNSSKNSIFFVPNSHLCRAMLPNYLRKKDLCRAVCMLPDCLGTLLSTLCQFSAFKEAFG